MDFTGKNPGIDCHFLLQGILLTQELNPLLHLLHCQADSSSLYLYYCTIINYILYYYLGSPGGSNGKESACNTGDRGQSLGWEDSLEKEKAAHSSVLAWRIPWTEEPGGLQYMESQKAREIDFLEITK